MYLIDNLFIEKYSYDLNHLLFANFWSCWTISSLISLASGTSSVTQASSILLIFIEHIGHDFLPTSLHCSKHTMQNEWQQARIRSGVLSRQIQHSSPVWSKLNFGSSSSFKIVVWQRFGLELADCCFSSIADIASKFVVIMLKTWRNCLRFIILMLEICLVVALM